jgi:hypothetical protein
VLGRTTGNTDTQDSPQPGLGGSHHLPPYSILCDSPRDPHAFLSRDSRAGVPKSRPAGLPGLWSPITFRKNLGSKCGLKQSCSSRRELSNGMLHVVCSQVFWVDSRLLVVGSQNWQTPSPSFGHNLCFRCPNQQCEPILDIYASRAFHWYKERHKPLRFVPSNQSLKFWESTGTPSPKVGGSCLGSVRVHSLTLSYTPGSPWCDSRASFWPAPLQPFCLGCEPKARVATSCIWLNKIRCKNFEGRRIHFEKATRKMIIFFHLVDFFYSLGLEFVAPSVDKMCRKFSCKKTC